MGASNRKEAVAYFSNVAVATSPPADDAFAEKLAVFGDGLCSGSEFFSLAQPIVQELVAHNAETGRMQWLLRYVGTVLEAIRGTAAGATPAQVAALTVTELTLRHALASTKGSSARMLALLEGDQGTNPGGALCDQLVSYVVHVSLDGNTATAHAAVARLLLTLTSSALHHETAFSEDSIDVFTEMIMSNKALPQFVGVLLDRAVAWGEGVSIASPLIYAEGCDPKLKGFFGGLFGGGGASKAAAPPTNNGDSMAGGSGSAPGKVESRGTYFSVTADEKTPGKNVYASSVASDRVLRHSSELLALLVAHQKGNGRNPALEYVMGLTNTEVLPFSVILTSLSKKLADCPTICMLLYAFLHDHPTFLHETLRSHQRTLVGVVESILRITHTTCGLGGAADAAVSRGASNGGADDDATIDVQENPLSLDSLGRIERDLTFYSYPFVNFMTSTLMLILSQDRVINQLMCDSACVMTFGLDRHQRPGTRLPVGSLALQVVAAGVIKAINDRNEPLASVFAPCMANMAVFAHHLDTHTAQRVVGVLLIMLRKIRLVDAAYVAAAAAPQHGKDAAAASGTSAPSNPYVYEDVKGLVALGDMLIRLLRMVVEAVEGLLRGTDRSNESLIYELLYERDRIIGASPSDPAEGGEEKPSRPLDSARQPFEAQAREVLKNVANLITSYEAEIASAPSATSPKDIIAVIKQCSGAGQNGSTSVAVDAQGEAAGAEASAADQGPVAADGVSGGAAGGATAVDLLYTYEESPHSYDFFGPFVWATLLSDARWPGGVLWCRKVSELALFSQ